MNIITFDLENRKYFRKASRTYDDHFKTLISYITEEMDWGGLLDPIRRDSVYSCGNYYYTKQDDLYFYIAEDYYLEDHSKYEPTVILMSTLHGIFVAFHCMKQHKVQSFSLIKEYKRYIAQADGMKPIIIDPDLGYLYNDTIARITCKRINGTWTPFFYSINNIDNIFIDGIPLVQELELFYNLFIKQYNQTLLETILNWDHQKRVKKQVLVRNNVHISNYGSSVYLVPAKTKDAQLHLVEASILKGVCLLINKPSLIKFLQAWDTKLQHANAFTMVFLGSTVRYFEGEPLPFDK